MKAKIISIIMAGMMLFSLTATGVSAKTLNEIFNSREVNIKNAKQINAELIEYTKAKFKDMKATAWYTGSAAILVGLGGVDGFSDGTFAPDDTATGAQFTKMLLAAMGYKQEIGKYTWYSNYVDKAKELGVIEDIDKYDYTKAMLRKEMAKMICKILKLEPKAGVKTVFTDATGLDTKWIDTAFQEYLIRGSYNKGIRTFDPNDSLTRAQACEMIVRALEYRDNPQEYKKEWADYFAKLEKDADIKDSGLLDPNSPVTPEQAKILNSYEQNKDADNLGLDTSNSDYIKIYGLEDAKKMVELAKNYIEALNTVDYRTIGEDYRNKMKKVKASIDYSSIEKIIQRTKDNKIIAEGTFLTDPAFVYVSNTGNVRVKGVVKYIVHSCTDLETIYGKGAKLEQWIEEDREVEFVYDGINYFIGRKIPLSNEMRFVGGGN